MVYGLAFLIGVVAGLRAMTAPAAASWAAATGRAQVQGGMLSFMGAAITPWVFTVLAVLELIADQLPKTPSRKTPVQFGARVISGALSGATIGAGTGALAPGLVLGALGAIAGTFGGYELRARLAKAFKRDTPAALIEDAVAIGAAVLIVCALP
jgi:uncharacterized membrane protein